MRYNRELSVAIIRARKREISVKGLLKQILKQGVYILTMPNASFRMHHAFEVMSTACSISKSKAGSSKCIYKEGST